jgi:hypothetical protein
MAKKKNKKPQPQNPSQKRDYYKNLIIQHKSVLAKARSLIATLLNKLEEEINSLELPQDESLKKANRTAWWGDKESASSILTRLTTILLKLIPLEQEIARLDLTKADLMEMDEVLTKTKLPEEDVEIIERYVQKYNESKIAQS